MWILKLNILYRKIDRIGDSYRTHWKEQNSKQRIFLLKMLSTNKFKTEKKPLKNQFKHIAK